MKYSKILLFSALLVVAASAIGQKTAEKPYGKWSKDEALKIINDSAWAKPYQSTTGATAAAAGQIAREQGQTSSSGGSNPRSVARDFGPPPVTLRLHSALPVRQAIVRLRQVAGNYEKMSDADKSAFDASQQRFLECSICKEYYVVTLTRAIDSSGRGTDEGVFQGMTFEELKGNVKLANEKGETRELAQFNPPKSVSDMAVFYFKRTDAAGQALLGPESKNLRVVFDPVFLDKGNRFGYLLPRTFEFKVSSMVIGENLAF